MSTTQKHYLKKSGSSTSSPSQRANPRSSTSTCTWSTRSLPRRRSKACAWLAARCAAPTAPSPRWTTTFPRRSRPSPHRRPDLGHAGQHAAQELRRVRHRVLRRASRLAGHRPRDRAELGATKPGMTIVCGDSHTSTHGAFGALAFGIGTSEVEHVMATQTLPQSKPKTFRIAVEGELPFGVTARTSSSTSSAGSAPTEPPATSSSTPVRPSARSPWKAA